MDLCLTRICDYRNTTPRFVDYDNVVLLISRPKDDDYLEIMRLYEELECRLTVLFSFKYHDDMGLFEEVWNMGYKQDQTPVYVEIFSDAAEAFECLYTGSIKPTIVIIDDEATEDIVKKNCAWYYVFPYKKVYARDNIKHIEALALAPLDGDKIPESRLYAKKPDFDRTRVTVDDVIENIPKCHILFTALGCFKRNYNYAIIISAFSDFMRKCNKIFGHKVMLILQGTSDRRDDKFRRELRRQVINTPFKKNIILLKKDLNDKEKKALLRMSYALIYMNSGMECISDLRLSLLVGTPIIALNKGPAKHICKNGVTGFMMSKLEVTKLSMHMQNMTDPTTYQYFSTSAREYFLYEHTFMKYTIDEFEKEDAPLQRRKAIVKSYMFRSDTVTELVAMESETVIELIPKISEMYSITDDNPEPVKSSRKSRYSLKTIEANAKSKNTKQLLPVKKVSSTRMIQPSPQAPKKNPDNKEKTKEKPKEKSCTKKPKKELSKTKLLIDLMICDLYEGDDDEDFDDNDVVVESDEELHLDLEKKSSEIIPLNAKRNILKKDANTSPIPSGPPSPKAGSSGVKKQTGLKNLPRKIDAAKSAKTENKPVVSTTTKPEHTNSYSKPWIVKKSRKNHRENRNNLASTSSSKIPTPVRQGKLKKSEPNSKTQLIKERRKNANTQRPSTETDVVSTSRFDLQTVAKPPQNTKEKKIQTYYNSFVNEQNQSSVTRLGIFSNTEKYLEQLNKHK